MILVNHKFIYFYKLLIIIVIIIIDQRTRKFMTMCKALHVRFDIDTLNVSGKEGGRGLANIEDNVNASIRGLDD